MVLMGFLANNLSRHVKENIGFSIVLNESAGEQQVHQLQRMLERADYVKAAQYISKEDALKEVMIELGENPEDVLGVNPCNRRSRSSSKRTMPIPTVSRLSRKVFATR